MREGAAEGAGSVRLQGSALKGVALVLGAYEVAAVATGKVPTVSALSHRYLWFEAALLAAFAIDVHYLQRKLALVKAE